jgi:NadR type nicotinamide-nucleotide adenylyltransferase
MKKIVIIGPESTGKSTLCEQLAAHYNTEWVREYAREYLLRNGAAYEYDDLLKIAKGQVLEEELVVDRWSLTEESANIQHSTFNIQPLFIDTDMYVIKVWYEYVFQKCHHWILNRIVERQYDLYLLCNIDLPWIKDELREYPSIEERRKLYHHYKDIMINQPVPWVEISGNYEERILKSITAIDKKIINS